MNNKKTNSFHKEEYLNKITPHLSHLQFVNSRRRALRNQLSRLHPWVNIRCELQQEYWDRPALDKDFPFGRMNGPTKLEECIQPLL